VSNLAAWHSGVPAGRLAMFGLSVTSRPWGRSGSQVRQPIDLVACLINPGNGAGEAPSARPETFGGVWSLGQREARRVLPEKDRNRRVLALDRCYAAKGGGHVGEAHHQAQGTVRG
jgi:hypothetical protein